MLGIALSAVGALLCATAASIHLLIAGRAVWGFGAALFFLNNTAILLDLFDLVIRGRAMGTFNGIEFASSLAGAPIGAFLAELLGYNAVFFFTVALTAVSLLFALLSKDLKRVEGGRLVVLSRSTATPSARCHAGASSQSPSPSSRGCSP